MARFLITGDTHGDIDSLRIFSQNSPITTLTKEDYLIICGDFGGLWYGDERDDNLLKRYSSLLCTTLFVDGNHENFDLLNNYKVEVWNGGKVHKIFPNVIHLMRGQHYFIDGKTFLTMGGAVSIDKKLRIEGISWWQEEIANEEEKQELFQSMKDLNYKVDYILSHCAPTTALYKMRDRDLTADKMTDLLDEIYYNMIFKKWYFGHYHRDMEINNHNNNLVCIYKKFIEITK